MAEPEHKTGPAQLELSSRSTHSNGCVGRRFLNRVARKLQFTGALDDVNRAGNQILFKAFTEVSPGWGTQAVTHSPTAPAAQLTRNQLHCSSAQLRCTTELGLTSSQELQKAFVSAWSKGVIRLSAIQVMVTGWNLALVYGI